MFAWLALTVFAQAVAPKKAPDAVAVSELVRKSNDLRGFVAVYKVSTDKATSTWRFAYRAPDEFRYEVMGMLMVGRRGTVDIRATPPGGKPSWARVSAADASAERASALSSAIATEFPAIGSSWSLNQNWGPMFEVGMTTVDDGRHDRFDLTFAQVCPRGSLFGWLEKFLDSSDASVEGERFVVRTPRGSEVRISARTGFIESMHRKDDRGSASIDLESLDLDPKLEPGEFDAPEPEPGAKDESESFRIQSGQTITAALGKKSCGWISERVASASLAWDADSRRHARKVLEALLAAELTSDSRRWTGETRKWIDGLGKWVGDCRMSAPNGGAVLPDEVETKLHQSRDRLLETIRSAENSRLRGASLASEVADPRLRKDLEDLADEAWTAAFARVVHDPLVEAFDDTVARAKGGN
jgi:hypothetical protein